MVRISRYKLKEEILLKIYRLFFEIIAHSNSQVAFLDVINDIFSPTEKIMIAKRIAIVYLLIKKIEQRDIATTLKVSTGTVSKFAILFNNKETKTVKLIEKMLLKEKVLNFLEDTFADLFIQPGIKIGHWDSYWKHERAKQKRKETGL